MPSSKMELRKEASATTPCSLNEGDVDKVVGAAVSAGEGGIKTLKSSLMFFRMGAS